MFACHHDGDFDLTTGILKKAPRLVLTDMTQLANEPYPAFHKFPGFGLQIHHSVSIHFPQLDHAGGGEHVEDHFTRGTGFEPR